MELIHIEKENGSIVSVDNGKIESVRIHTKSGTFTISENPDGTLKVKSEINSLLVSAECANVIHIGQKQRSPSNQSK